MPQDNLVVPDSPATPSTSRRWLIVAVIVACVALIGGAGAWWYFVSRAQIPDWERVAQLDLVVPAGDAFDAATPWVQIQAAPVRPGVESTVSVGLATDQATPTAGATERSIAAVTVLPLDGATEATALALQPGENGALVGATSFDHPGWWRIDVLVSDAPEPAVLYLLVPDPNINGPNAVPATGSSPDGEALYQRGSAATSALQSVGFTQWIADPNGNAAVSERVVVSESENSPSGLIYRASDGTEVVVIGSTRWVRNRQSTEWQQQEGTAIVPPAEWGEEYDGATGFTVLGQESVAGRQASLVAFVVPERSEPRRQIVAWYLWWVDDETGHILQEAMVSRVHYMLNRFSDFDSPVILTPPDQPATPVASATPVA